MISTPLGGIASSLGNALGVGGAQAIESGLKELSQQKLLQLQQAYQRQTQEEERKRYAAGIEPLFGKEVSLFLSNLAPEERKVVMQNPGVLMQLAGQGIQQGTAKQLEGMQQISQPEVSLFGQQAQSEKPLTGVQALQNIPAVNTMQQDRLKLLQDLFTSPEQRRRNEELDISKERLALEKGKSERQISSDAREFSAPYIKAAENAANNTRDFKMLYYLAKTGKLRSGFTHQVLSKFGLEKIGPNWETQLADKIVARIATTGPAAFGVGRFTNYLEQIYQRANPSLFNTKEGIETLSQLGILANDVIQEKNKIREQILKENNYNLSPDIEDKIQERLKPYRDKKEEEAMRLVQPYTNIREQNFNDLPNASTYKNKKILDHETGAQLISNGEEWVPYKTGMKF